jgi:hypothetical protein
VLALISDVPTVTACLSGACGCAAREWYEAQYPSLFDKMREEIGSVCFRIAADGWSNIAIDDGSLAAWTPAERALLGCLPNLFSGGSFLGHLFELIAEMDQRIATEFARLREEARRANIGIRSPMFAVIYVLQGPGQPAIGCVCASIGSGCFERLRTDMLTAFVASKIGDLTLSPGQIHLLAQLGRGAAERNTVFASFVAWAIEQFWSRAPQHLRIALADAAGWCWEVPEEQRSALIETLESRFDNQNVVINTTIFESLQRLGGTATAEAEHEETVHAQLESLLSGPNSEEAWSQAYSLYNCQFDHPYSNAYCEALNDLVGERRNRFLVMAARGARDASLFLPILLFRAWKT